MPVNTEDEQGVAWRNLLFILLHRVIVHTACHGKVPEAIKQKKRLCLATPGS